MSVRVEHDYYGVPLWLMKDYLEQLGGHELAGAAMEGDGCRAELRKAQSGNVRNYAAAISLGAVAVLAWFVLRGVL